MRIDHEAEQFPYEQLASLLRQRIRDGQYPPGRPIPSLSRLQQETGLSVKTIRRAINVLAGEGIVHVRPGWGTFVVRQE